MIVLTTTSQKCEEISSKYPDLDFYHFPCIEYAEPSDSYKALDAAIRSNHHYEWVFFLSPKSAESFFDRLIAIGGNFFNLSNHLKFAVIGKGTKDFMENEVNMPVDFIPSEANSKVFIDEFCSKYKYDFECAFKVLLPRSELAHDDFKENLERSKNYQLDIVPAYNTGLPSSNSIADLDKVKKAKTIIFTSSSCVENFFKLVGDLDIGDKNIYSIGTKTTQSFLKHKPEHKNFLEAKEANLDSLLSACR